MNGTEQRGFGRAFCLAVVDEIYKDGHTERVAQQNEFIARIVAILSRVFQEFESIEPFLRGWPHVLHECVKVLDQALHDLLQPRIRCILERPQHVRCDFLGGFISHVFCGS